MKDREEVSNSSTLQQTAQSKRFPQQAFHQALGPRSDCCSPTPRRTTIQSYSRQETDLSGSSGRRTVEQMATSSQKVLLTTGRLGREPTLLVALRQLKLR